MRTIASLLLSWSAAMPASAQVAYSFTPNPATPSDTVRVRVETDLCYDRTIHVEVDAVARTITGRTHVSDLPCNPFDPANFVNPRYFTVGTLPAGTYQARLLSCVDFTPTPGCFTTFHQETVVVRGVSAAPLTVPASSPWSIALLAIGAMAVVRWIGRASELARNEAP